MRMVLKFIRISTAFILTGLRHRQKVCFVFIIFVILSGILYYISYIYTIFDVIPDSDIAEWLVPTTSNFQNVRNLCPTLVNEDVNLTASDVNKSVGEAGEWRPANCSARFLVALIIPYRDRASHLSEFVRDIHPFLQRQNIHYKIYVVEQADTKEFNRGKLLNVGFVEALKEKPFPCFIFHDVDLLPENVKNIYACTRHPRHMASSIDKFGYRVPYDRNFGGVTSILTRQFRKVNGFSNNFFGWGGEDDDFLNRVLRFGLRVVRFSQHISKYRSLSHETATASADRYDKLKEGPSLHRIDGINSLHYVLDMKLVTPVYVKLVVKL